MKNRNIDKIVSKVLKETLESKIEGIESEIENLTELGGMPSDVHDDEHPFKNVNFGKMTNREIEQLMSKHMGNDEEEEDEWDVTLQDGLEDEEDNLSSMYGDDYEEDEEEDEEEYDEELEEGFDDPFIKGARDGEDYSEREFKRMPLGKGQIGLDQDMLDRNTGITFEKEFTDDFLSKFDLRDLMDDDIIGDDNDDDLEPMSEGVQVCNECGSKALMEGECSECGYTMESEMEEGIYNKKDLNKKNKFDYVQEDLDFNEYDTNPTEPNKERCKVTLEIMRKGKKCDYCEDLLEIDNCKAITESLTNRQKRTLDKNKNNKIDAEDFKLLRKGKKKETKESGGNDHYQAFNPYNPSDARDEHEPTNTDVKIDPSPRPELVSVTDDKHITDDERYWSMMGYDSPPKSKKSDKQEKENSQIPDDYDDENEESFGSKLKSFFGFGKKETKEGKKFPDLSGDGKVTRKDILMGRGVKLGKKKAKLKESIQLSEEEMIDLIENIIKEQKAKDKNNIKSVGKARGLEAYEKAHKGSGKENEDNIKSVAKKMKDYLKDGSKGEYSDNPKHFPKGNGQLEKMKAKKYTMSKDGDEFLNDFMRPGMENLVPDEIQYDEDWVSDNIKGSSRTGNNPEWANAEETELGNKINKKRKDKKYHKVKMAAYRKSKQPVTDGTGEMAGEGTNIKLESENVKQLKMLNEEFSKINNLISYNRKTQ